MKSGRNGMPAAAACFGIAGSGWPVPGCADSKMSANR